MWNVPREKGVRPPREIGPVGSYVEKREGRGLVGRDGVTRDRPRPGTHSKGKTASAPARHRAGGDWFKASGTGLGAGCLLECG